MRFVAALVQARASVHACELDVLGPPSDAVRTLSAHYVLGTNDEAGGWPVAASLAVHSQPWLAGI